MKNERIFDSVSGMTFGRTAAFMFALFFIFTGCATTSPPPPATGSGSVAVQEGVPGGIFVNTVEVKAKVIGIDLAGRKVTLLKPDGKQITVTTGPEAVNLDQVRVNDLVKVTLTEELVVYLDKEGTPFPDSTAGIVTLAPKGARPGGVMAEITQVTATVAAIDPAGRTATLRFDDGSLKSFPVRDDIDLAQYTAGEKVVFLVTDMVAIFVEKQ